MLSHCFKLLFVSFIQLALLLALTAANTHADNSQRLDKDSLQELLLADFASYRGHYHQALQFYLKQAEILQSAQIAEDATRIALYLKQYNDMLKAGLLWQQYSNDHRDSLFYLAIAYSLNKHYNHAYQSMALAYEKGHPSDFTRLVFAIPAGSTALDSYKTALQKTSKSSDNPDLFMALATIAEKQNDAYHVTLYATKAIEASNYNQAFVELGIPLLEQTAEQKALLKIYRKSLQANPSSNYLRHKYALYLTGFAPNDAKQQLKILNTQAPDNSDYIFHLALLHLELNELSEAKSLFKALLTLKEKTAPANYYLGLISQYENNPNSAIKYFSRITNPAEKQKISVEVAKAYINGKRYEQALQITHQALRNPTNLSQKNRLLATQADIHQLMGDSKKALSILDQLSLQNHKNDDELLYLKAMLYYKLGELSKMETDLKIVINRNPEHSAAMNALGFTLADQSIRLDEALNLIQTAHKLEPNDPAVLDSLGWVLYRLGRTDEAIKYLRSAREKLHDAEVAAHLGEVLWVSGKKHDAEAVFTEALNLEPEHRVLNETIKRLAVPIQ